MLAFSVSAKNDNRKYLCESSLRTIRIALLGGRPGTISSRTLPHGTVYFSRSTQEEKLLVVDGIAILAKKAIVVIPSRTYMPNIQRKNIANTAFSWQRIGSSLEINLSAPNDSIKF